MRSKKVLINSIFGILGYGILMLSNFITRKVFVDTLGLSMAGVDTVFKNFLQVLSLAELGLSTGLIYKLYKPIEEHDNIAIKKVLNFYKQAYKVIAGVFLLGAFVLAFIVPSFTHDTDKSYLYLGFLFFLYAGDTVASYLFANRKALIVADQNNYIVNRNDAGISLMSLLLQVLFLYLTKSFILYAVIKIFCRLTGAFLIGRKFNKMYPEVAAIKTKEMISGEERKSLLHNMSAMLCHKIGSVSVTASGSAIISGMISTVQAGIYGNYVLITNTVIMLITQVFGGITASFGNILTVEKKEVIYRKFNMLYFFNYAVISFCTVSVAVLIQPFMKFWIGSDPANLFPQKTVILLLCYFYVFGIRRVILMAKDSAGLYRPDRYFAVAEAVINIVMSIGFISISNSVDGLILANVLSMLIIPFWTQPIIVYKQILKQNPAVYYAKYFIYAAITAGLTVLTCFLANSVVKTDNLILEIILRAIICLIVPNVINFAIFARTNEFKDIIVMFKGLLKRKN